MEKLWVLIDSGIAWLKGKLNPEGLDKLDAKLQAMADRGIPVAAGVMVLTGIGMSAKLDDSDYIATGIGGAIGVVALGYLSHRFTEGCRTAGMGDRSKLSLEVYLDLIICGLILASVGAVLAGLGLLFDGEFDEAAAVWSGGFVCLLCAWTFNDKDRLGVEIDTEAGASNDLLSLYSISLRALLRIAVPVSSFVVIVATAMTLLSMLGLLASDGMDSYKYTAGVTAGTMMILGGVAAPVYVYLYYAVLSFLVSFAENILSIKDIAKHTRE